MIVGDPSILAIETSITQISERKSFLAMGFIVIHIRGFSYGIRAPDATMLGCSYDAIRRRISKRGHHTAPFAKSPAKNIAHSFRSAFYADRQEDMYFGIKLDDFVKIFDQGENDLVWVPDGDEAFDDGSYILQFDIGNKVRIIAFKSGASWEPDPSAITEIWMPEDVYYQILQEWCDLFDAEFTR